MTSNRTVTYIDMKLNSVEEYWKEIIIPAIQTVRSANTPSPSAVFQSAIGVWHLHDERNLGQNSCGAAFDIYRNQLIAACPEFGWLRDVADASKHRGLGLIPEVAGAEPQMVMPPYVIGGGLIVSPRLTFVPILSDGSRVKLDSVLRAACDFWMKDIHGNKLKSPFQG